MPQKDFIIWLNEKTYMQVDFVTVRGNVVSFTVRLMVIESSGEVNLARYDAAHETPNLDVYGRRKGQIRKEWLSGVKPEKVLSAAIVDFKQNHEKYVTEFLRN